MTDEVLTRLRLRAPFLRGLIRPIWFNGGRLFTATTECSLDLHPTDRSSVLSRQLRSAFTTHGSDKSRPHDYHVPYSVLLENMPAGPILEIGIGSNNPDVPSNMGLKGVPGASLRAWSSLGRFSWVHGADIDRRILFTDHGITTHHVDQLSPPSIGELKGEMSRSEPEGFSLIVDDGLHGPEANINTIDGLFDLVKPGGFFVIEDVFERHLAEMIQHVLSRGWTAWGLWSSPRPRRDNQLVFVRR